MRLFATITRGKPMFEPTNRWQLLVLIDDFLELRRILLS